MPRKNNDNDNTAREGHATQQTTMTGKGKDNDTTTSEKGGGYILRTNIEHDGKRHEVGTVIRKWFGTQEDLDALLEAGAVEAYTAPKVAD